PREAATHSERGAREARRAGGVRRDRALEGLELRRDGERLTRDRFDREVQWHREDEGDRRRERDPHPVPMSERILSLTAARTSLAARAAIGGPKLTRTRFAWYAGSASCSSVAMRWRSCRTTRRLASGWSKADRDTTPRTAAGITCVP